MTYTEATEWLFAQLPMFQREGAAAYRANLDGTWRTLKMLDRPDLKLPQVIHVGGTNGKGSVCTMVAHALSDSGLRTGLFTSPHMVDFRERMRVDGEMPSESWVINFVQTHRELWDEEKPRPSFFEWTFGMALQWFVEMEVALVVLETGMGGRLDSTNVFPNPLVTAITNIGLDHVVFLGPDIRTIAAEKAGIVKNGCPVVLGRMRPDAQSVIMQQALRQGSEIYYADASENTIGLAAPFRNENRATAHKILQVLSKCAGWGDWSLPTLDTLRLDGHLGRWHWLETKEMDARILLDCAHNADGLQRTLEAVHLEGWDQLHLVFGTVEDKTLDDVWPLLPESAHFYWCAANIPRAMPARVLKVKAAAQGFEGIVCNRVSHALDVAKQNANATDLILVCGSIFVVAEILETNQ